MDNKQIKKVNKIIESNTPETPKILEQKIHLYYCTITTITS